MATKFHFELNDQFLSRDEQDEFREFLQVFDLERNIWEIFESLFRSGVKNGMLTIITDYTNNASLFQNSSILPALPHALIDCSEMSSLEDYLGNYKNIKRKIKTFRNKGGEYLRVEGKLSEQQLLALRRCFISTAENSVFYLPPGFF